MAEISRRSFLSGAAVAGAALASMGIAGCAAPQNATAPSSAASAASSGSAASAAPTAAAGIPESWDAEADVIVLGAGGTGLSAACAAAEAGASVQVYDVDIKAGGTTALSGGVIQAAGTQWQKEMTDFKDDTPEKHAECYIEQAEGRADEELVKAMTARAPELMEWLASIGIKWTSVYGNHHVPYVTEGLHADRIHVYEGGGGIGEGGVLTDTEFAEAERLGVEFFFEHKAEHLICNGEAGVVGVQISSGSKTLNVKANKGVVLALGGMDRDEEMAAAFNPQLVWDLTEQTCMISEFAQGDGIRMGMEVNAALATVGGCIDFDAVTGNATNNTLPQIPCIFVNGAGNRFVCEDATYAYTIRAIFQQEKQYGAPTWMIMDKHMVDQGAAAWAADPEAAASGDFAGDLFVANTIEELAEAIEVPAVALKGTVDTWNAMAAEGADQQYGRTMEITPLDTPPFVAHRNRSANLGSLGGLKIDTNAQVIDNNGNPIPHLYAGGMNAGGWYGSYYPGSGTSLTGGLVFGHIAGESAAAAEAWA